MDEQFFFDTTEIFRGLNPEQVEAVNCLEGPLLIMAGAGSGKTRVLTCRIANLIAQGISPRNILAITFTNKAANEMKARAANLIGAPARGVWLSTFHSFCARILQREIEITGEFTRNFAIYDAGDTKSLIKQCVTELNLDEKFFVNAHLKISDLKNELISVEEFKSQVFNNLHKKNLSMIYELYQKRLRENNAMDFDDLLFEAVKLFQNYPDVLARYQERFRYISVDEYQDTNAAQYQLTKLLAARYKNLCVVGDADQSIYGWRGADMRNILNFKQDYPRAHVVMLEQNYRSTKTILSAANAVISNNFDRVPKKLWTANESGDKIKFTNCFDDRQEAEVVAREIRRLVVWEKFSYSDIALLYRMNAQSRMFEERFMQEGIPYIIIGGLKFYDRKEIRDIIAYLHVIANPKDGVHLQRIINTPRRGLGITNVNRLMQFASDFGLSVFEIVVNPKILEQVAGLTTRFRADLRAFVAMMMSFMESAKTLPVDKLIQVVLEESGYMKSLDSDTDAGKREAESRKENLGEFINSAKDFVARNPDGTLEEFLNHVALITDADAAEEEDARVRLMTVHAAKGLEFPAVFLVGMEENIFPHASAIDKDDELEEERRACYVALTRAEKKLYITAAQKRMYFGDVHRQDVSRFVKEIPDACLDGSGYKKSSPRQSTYRAPTAHRSAQIKKPAQTSAQELLQKIFRQSKPKESKPRIVWKVGDVLQHKLWGLGTVMAVEGTTITVLFANPEIGNKKLAANVAPIVKVG